MKKRMISMLLAGTLVLSMAGCAEEESVFSEGKKKETESVVETTTDESQKETIQETVNEESETGTETEESPVTQTKEAEGSNFLFDFGKVVLLDTDGYATKTYELSELISSANATEQEKALLECADFSAVYGNDFIFKISNYLTEDNISKVFVLDIEDGTVDFVVSDEGFTVDSCEIYDEKLYVTGYDTADYSKKIEKCFVKTNDAYQEIENPTQAILDQYGYLGNCLNTFYSTHASYTATLKETGHLIFGENGEFMIVNEAGEGNPYMIEDASYVYAYSSRYVYYYTYDSATYNSINKINDLESNVSIELPSEYTSVYFWDDLICATVNESEEYGITEYHMYSLNPVSGAKEEIYSCKGKPGMQNGLVAGVTGLKYINGRFYYLAGDGNSAAWFMTKNTDAGYSEEKLGVSVQEFDIFDYGNVNYLSYREICENCGWEYGDVYMEVFECTLDYPGVDKINEALSERMNTMYTDAIAMIADCGYDDEECHGQATCVYTDDVSVTNVKLLGTHYLAVDYSGYDYAGGAHGYPYLDQFLYDLNTGEMIKLLDLYPGSEEELRSLIAEKTREDYKSYENDEYPPYFAQDADSAYSEAYDCCLDSSALLFDEDGLYVEYYPYCMGPYAAGFIEVFVSYEELGFSFD